MEYSNLHKFEKKLNSLIYFENLGISFKSLFQMIFFSILLRNILFGLVLMEYPSKAFLVVT